VHRITLLIPALISAQALSTPARSPSASVAPVTVRHDSFPSKRMHTVHSQMLT
jgi:hypothetical protein